MATKQETIDYINSLCYLSLFEWDELPDHLKTNKEVALAAAKKNGYIIKHSSSRIRNDADVVGAALENDISSIQFIGQRLQSLKFVTPYIEEHRKKDSKITLGQMYKFFPDKMKYKKDVIIAVFESKEEVYYNFFWFIESSKKKELRRRLLDDVEVMRAAYQNASDTNKPCTQKFCYYKTEKELILECASERIRNDPALLEMVICPD